MSWNSEAGPVRGRPFFTLGHATRSINEFVELLQSASVKRVVDVRTVPRSRTNPQYNLETLPQSLAAHAIRYEHIAALGGLRGRKREVPRATNAFWQNDGFHNYADYAMSETFRTGLAHLRELGHEQRCAIMCAETLWWRCHRRIITDYLIAAGETVLHILGPRKVEPAEINPAARVQPDGHLTYPAES
ncbi:DUF488 domain-containing protein [Bradyrhizobium sp. CB1650]|uniref:DUF488 domain-containing protein n=1 Tax=Bradyrhizobium sp. CB1650 TaxID=3039153 RepID=UPI0024358B58|nr:DUF488 domain-containing protein [Bradyrhizobium sp. CB1650]WGD53767.1 DUF488 domain-containing protein [Bradyrhizobium sp. CB1650]